MAKNVLCGCGKDGCVEGTLSDTGVYTKPTWKPFKEIFCNGTRYLFLRAWTQIKDHAQSVELHDKSTGTVYTISTQEAARHGEEFTFPVSPKHSPHATGFLLDKVWRIPVQHWVASRG